MQMRNRIFATTLLLLKLRSISKSLFNNLLIIGQENYPIISHYV